VIPVIIARSDAIRQSRVSSKQTVDKCTLLARVDLTQEMRNSVNSKARLEPHNVQSPLMCST
jgi:hypothetical protein